MTATLPNAITAMRLVMVPVAVFLLFIDGDQEGAARWWSLILVVLASLTDWLDGYLARRWNVVSSFGKLADPIADKALVLGVLAGLVWVDGLPWWPLAVLVVREVGVTVGRLAVAKGVVIPASRGGKLKTVLQMAAIIMFLIPGAPGWIDVAAWWILVAAVVVAVVTGIDYARMIARAARAHRESRDGATNAATPHGQGAASDSHSATDGT
ncbi:CDP-diacylglycerol--glycerol-3-phosphate 3-phosphatidyltransferase [Demequina globuliformis]|uniref:CDP-diacylglycerol--glycerol-3-phosphate 3-phosphatidyltransferase n=1 Tax=Demequina globuliformis TaxID=676202 RepID=UPI0007833C41|nr:CDP-diacylglycerol--glycerol-3-phosphate 3-phosphatidyltransferase [Demequina globuliformis]